VRTRVCSIWSRRSGVALVAVQGSVLAAGAVRTVPTVLGEYPNTIYAASLRKPHVAKRFMLQQFYRWPPVVCRFVTIEQVDRNRQQRGRSGTGPVPRGRHSWSRPSSRSSNLPGRLFTGWAAEVYERRDSALLLMGFAGGVSAERPRRSEQRGRSHAPVGRGARAAAAVEDRQEGERAVRPLPFTTSRASCPPCAYFRWAQVVSACDTAGSPGVIRFLRTTEPFGGHVCRGALPRVRARAPLFLTT
jgi:hypothetical protein